MKKKSPVITVILLVMSGVILASIFYVSSLLNGKGSASVTQIQKTKASAQTYHKLLALNDIPITPVDNETGSTPTPINEPAVSPTTAPTIAPTVVAATPLPTVSKSPTPTTVSEPTLPAVSPTVAPTIPSVTLIPPTAVPTKQSLLLAYHNPSPTVVAVTDANGTGSITVTKKPTTIPTKTQALPETGWVQTPLILFIVASSTILLSLLF